jgi:hypothetical protein
MAHPLARLGVGPRADVIRRAADGSAATVSGRPITLVHGDFHLGPLGRQPFARAAVVAAAANHPNDDLLVAACARMR